MLENSRRTFRRFFMTISRVSSSSFFIPKIQSEVGNSICGRPSSWFLSFLYSSGAFFPPTPVVLSSGISTTLASLNSCYKLLVFYRGSFSFQCREHLEYLDCHLEQIKGLGIEIVAVSADDLETTRLFIQSFGEKKLGFQIGCGLSVDQMRTLGLYITECPLEQPQQPQQGMPLLTKMQRSVNFCEPAYIFLTPQNSVKYVVISSYPGGGRVNVPSLENAILEGFESLSEEKHKIHSKSWFPKSIKHTPGMSV